MEQYRRLIPTNIGPGYGVHWRFDNVQDLVTCLSQPHIQDVFYFHEDIVEIATVDVHAALLPINSNATEVWAVLDVNEDIVSIIAMMRYDRESNGVQESTYAATWRRVIQSTYPFAVAVKSGRRARQTIWDARFAVKPDIEGMDDPKPTVLRMKLRSPPNRGKNKTGFKTWEQALNSDLQD